jgi:serine/threonine-protein kinase
MEQQGKPERLGKYVVRGVLGRGAMGTVYAGWDALIEREVAIKTVRLPDPDDAEAQEELARFRRGAQAAGRLSHPNLVGVYDYGEADGVAYIVMELIEGQTLKDAVADGHRMPVADILRIMGELLSGLAYAHGRGVIHRDVKPANVILTREGQAKLTDFGIARIESSSMTQAGTVLGTPAYMSPEQFTGQVVDARTDIYAAGVMFYQLLAGERPFEGSPTAIMHKALTTRPPKPSDLSVTAPTALDAVVERAIARRPEDRYPTAAAFAEAITAAVRPAAVPPAIPATPVRTLPDAQPDATIVVTARPGSPRPESAEAPVGPRRPSSRPVAPDGRTGAPKSARQAILLVIAGVVLLGGGGAGAWWGWSKGLFGPHPVDETPPLKPEPQKPEPQKPEPQKPEPQKPEPQKPEPQRPEPQKPEPQKPEPQKPEPQRPEPQKPEPQKPEPQKPEPQKPEPQKPEPQRPEPQRPEPQRPEPQGPEPQKPEPQKPEPQKPEPQKPEPQKPEPQKPEPQKPEPQKPEPQVNPPVDQGGHQSGPIAPDNPGAKPLPPGADPSNPPGPPPATLLRQRLAEAVNALPCALPAGDVGESGGATIRGLVGKGISTERLRTAAEAILPGRIEYRMLDFSGVTYCRALNVIRPYAARRFGAIRSDFAISLKDGRTALVTNDRLVVEIDSPEVPGVVQIDYLQHDGKVWHMHPSRDEPEQPLQPHRRMTYGEPRGAFGGWTIQEPYGRDMIIAIASTNRLFPNGRPEEEDAAAYLDALKAALQFAEARGDIVFTDAIVLDTSQRH